MTDPPICSTTATPGARGSYPVSCSGAVDPDYTISYVAGTLTIQAVPTPSVPVVTAPSMTIVHGSALPGLVPAYSGFTAGDSDTSSLTSPAVCSTTATSSSAAGSYPVTCSGAIDLHYVTATSPAS